MVFSLTRHGPSVETVQLVAGRLNHLLPNLNRLFVDFTLRRTDWGKAITDGTNHEAFEISGLARLLPFFAASWAHCVDPLCGHGSSGMRRLVVRLEIHGPIVSEGPTYPFLPIGRPCLPPKPRPTPAPLSQFPCFGGPVAYPVNRRTEGSGGPSAQVHPVASRTTARPPGERVPTPQPTMRRRSGGATEGAQRRLRSSCPALGRVVADSDFRAGAPLQLRI
jgi:hypothetical protein